jgi:hypothetical protein
MDQSEITTTLRRALTLAFRYWKEHCSWPARSQIIVKLKREGLDFDNILSRDLWPYVNRSGSGTIELSLLGIREAEGAEQFLQYLVPATLRGIELYLEDPRGNPKFTSGHFREVSVEWDDAQVTRAARLYYYWLINALGGGGSRSGDGLTWSIDLSSGCLRFRDIRTVSDFLDRKEGAHLTNEELDTQQRECGRWVIKQWRSTPDGPSFTDTVLAHLSFGDPADVVSRLQRSQWFRVQRSSNRGEGSIEPSFRGLIGLRPETDADLEKLVKVLRAVHDCYYSLDAEREPHLSEVATQASLDEATVVRLLGVADSTLGIGCYMAIHNGVDIVSVNDDVFRLGQVDSLDDLLSLIDAVEKERRKWDEPYVSSETSPEDVFNLLVANLQLTERQRAVAHSLHEKDCLFGDMYLGGLRVLADQSNQDRFALAAHALRELMEKLSRSGANGVKGLDDHLKSRNDKLKSNWEKDVKQTQCFREGSWKGEIDAPLRRVLNQVAEFFKWYADHYPQIKQETGQMLRSFGQEAQTLPEEIAAFDTEKWIKTRSYFIDIAHHRRPSEPSEFQSWLVVLEKILLDLLLPRFSAAEVSIGTLVEDN